MSKIEYALNFTFLSVWLNAENSVRYVMWLWIWFFFQLFLQGIVVWIRDLVCISKPLNCVHSFVFMCIFLKVLLLSQLHEDVVIDKSNKRIVLDSNQGSYGKDFYLKSACNLYTNHHASNTFNDNNILWIINYDICGVITG